MNAQFNIKKDLIKDIMNPFTLDEAVSLIYRLAVLKKDAPQLGKKLSITQIGHICGVLTLNDQIEIVVKFHDQMRNSPKRNFMLR